MRHKRIIMLCMVAVAVHASVMAQTNVKKAFDKLIKNSGVNIVARHSLDKDPETGKKSSQCDVYEFNMPKSKASLIKDIERAFEQDRDNAYSVSSGVSSSDRSQSVALAVGNGEGKGVALGKNPGTNYIYSCFLDPEDEQRKYRYAYAMDWYEKGNDITGKLVVTYATTLKSRQSASSSWSFNGSDYTVSESSSWLGTFNMYAKHIKNSPSSSATSIYVNNLYNQCKKPCDLTTAERNLVCDELNRLIKIVDDDFLKSLLKSAYKQILAK